MSYKDTMTYAVAMHDFDKMCKINFKKMIKKLEADPLIKKIIKECNEKEEKKMTMKFKMKHDKFKKLPYLDVKVVKVGKEEPKYFVKGKVGGRLVGMFAKKNGEICTEVIKPKKGWWVNGENLGKIKFPCFCSYRYFISGKKGDKSNGMLMKLGNNYYIANIGSQGDWTPYFVSYDLKFLIENFNIHILKGKIILWEEE